MYILFRFVIGIFNGGVSLIVYINATEFVGPKYRSLASTLFFICDPVAFGLLGVQAWLIPDWKMLQIITSIPYIVGLIAYW